ncbi:MAG: TerB N-terminal domain-containing protein [Caldilineaceae bacterium]|nr:TerB N-terminal domain-containing protein [Caldilineaceae bacterium]
MRRKIVRGIILPFLFWISSTALLIIFLPQAWAPLAPGYALLLPTVLITWWVIAFARWLQQRWGWENFPYLLSNLAIGFLQAGAVVAIAVAVTQQQQTLGLVLALLGGIVGISWFVISLWQRWQEGAQKRYPRPFWWALKSNTWFWRFWQPLPARQLTAATLVPPLATNLPPTPVPPPSTLFRPISVAAEPDPTAATPAIPIPPRVRTGAEKPATETPTPKTFPEQRSSKPAAVSISIIKEENFVAQAQQWVDRTETTAEPIPFAQYWPSYAQMSPAQQRWYFYWRTEVRAGNFLPTDLSYLFVYVYECINLIGFTDAQAAFDQLVLFWQHYRGLQPKLDQPLIDWLADFLVIHRLPMQPLTWYGQVVTQQIMSNDLDLLIQGWVQTGGDCTVLPSPLLYQLAGYSPVNSKFYQTYHQKQQLDAIYPKGVHAVDSYLRQSTGVPLFMTYMPLTMRAIQRPPFADALHRYPPTPILIGQVRPWQAQATLTNHLKSILKQTENVLREQLQFKTKLRGIELPPDWRPVIQQALTTTAAKRAIDIDFASINLLKRDSEEIRRRLIIVDETLTEEATPDAAIENISLEPRVIPPTANQPAEHTTTVAAYLQRPAETPPGSLTELVEIAAIMGDSTSATAQVLAALRQQQWQAPPTQLRISEPGIFLNVLLDQINEQAVIHLGDALIFDEEGIWVVAEDYRDEIAHLLDHPAYQATGVSRTDERPTPTPTTVPEQPSPAPVTPTAPAVDHELPAEWTMLSQQLQEQHWATLQVFYQGDAINSRLDSIARQVHCTANQLVDQVNELALAHIGDILIITRDATPCWNEEYREPLQQLCRSTNTALATLSLESRL